MHFQSLEATLNHFHAFPLQNDAYFFGGPFIALPPLLVFSLFILWLGPSSLWIAPQKGFELAPGWLYFLWLTLDSQETQIPLHLLSNRKETLKNSDFFFLAVTAQEHCPSPLLSSLPIPHQSTVPLKQHVGFLKHFSSGLSYRGSNTSLWLM